MKIAQHALLSLRRTTLYWLWEPIRRSRVFDGRGGSWTDAATRPTTRDPALDAPDARADASGKER